MRWTVPLKPTMGGIKFIVLAAVMTLTACRPPTATDNQLPTGPEEILLGSTHLTLEENRETLILRNGFERYEGAKTVTVGLRDLSQSDLPIVWEGPAKRYQDEEGSYWVVYPPFPHTGDWMLDITVDSGRGLPVTQGLITTVYDEPEGIPVGVAAPHSETFTWGAPDQPARITTDPTPNTAYYQFTIAQAVTSGKPSLIVFATPGLCTRKFCGPTVDNLDPIWQEYGERIVIVHVEVYNLDIGKYVPAVLEWGLIENPWLYVVDAEGMIVARYEGVIGDGELSPVLAALLE